MTTPATGDRLYLFDQHAARHVCVTGPKPNSRRRAGLRAALIAFKNDFLLGLPNIDAPEDGRMAEGARANKSFE
ncbi:unnamed protein product, partial [Nesidiocoris tenuis]